jgi:hypothetical protein
VCAHVLNESMKLLNTFHINRDCVILCVEYDEHLVLTNPLSHEDVNLAINSAIPAAKLGIMCNRRGRR